MNQKTCNGDQNNRNMQIFEHNKIRINGESKFMPFRKVVSKQMSNMLKALTHPHRLQLIEELGSKELDVNTLQGALETSHSHVSQHLAILRAHKIVTEHREGRFVYYRLKHPDLAVWLLEGLKFLSEEQSTTEQMREALDSARQVWMAQQQPQTVAVTEEQQNV